MNWLGPGRPPVPPEFPAPRPAPARTEAPPPLDQRTVQPPIRVFHVSNMASGQVIVQDIGFARWALFWTCTALSANDYDDALWAKCDDSAAFKVTQNTIARFVNGFRVLRLEYVDLGPQSQGISFDVLMGSDFRDVIRRPGPGWEMITWATGGPTQFIPPKIW